MVSSLLLAVTITAYVPNNPVGATGEPILSGLTCAVSRDMAHLKKTWIYVEGYGWRYVNDVTAARYKKRIDLAMGCRIEALNHGVKKSTISITHK